MNVWLDDLRPSPSGWVWTQSVRETIRLLVGVRVTILSLGYDLERTDPGHRGTEVLKWLYDHPQVRRPVIQFHTSHPVGAAKLAYHKRNLEHQARQFRRKTAGESS